MALAQSFAVLPADRTGTIHNFVIGRRVKWKGDLPVGIERNVVTSHRSGNRAESLRHFSRL